MAATQAFPMTIPSVADAGSRTEQALRWPVGAMSPLWAVFGAAASAGVAWWWMTRWTRAVNIEALAEVVSGQADQFVEAAADSELRAEEAVAAAEVAVAQVERPVVEAETPVAAPMAEAEAPVVEAVAAAVETPAADDLTRLAGIGPKLSLALAERGVTSFAQIAAWTADDLAEADAALKLKGRAVREAWVAQAKRLAKG
jgi:predicted flap endonuclease-1-like 5' DNA nuclease